MMAYGPRKRRPWPRDYSSAIEANVREVVEEVLGERADRAAERRRQRTTTIVLVSLGIMAGCVLATIAMAATGVFL